MKQTLILSLVTLLIACNNRQTATTGKADTTATISAEKHLYLDVHNLEPGKVSFADVANAHQKDLSTQGKYGVNFVKYWVDERAGKVYCLAESPDSASVSNTHKEAHGLVPDRVFTVSHGTEASTIGNGQYFLDIHQLGGPVTATAVADAHVKDLAVQAKNGVNFINYWVDEKAGIVACLSEARDSAAVANTHKEAHGLLPAEVHSVKQGQ